MSWPVFRRAICDLQRSEMNGAVFESRGILWLLRPKVLSKLSRTKTEEGRIFKWGVVGFVGLFFWAFIFGVIFRMLLYFRGTQGIRDLLAAKLLGLALMTFLMILLLVESSSSAVCGRSGLSVRSPFPSGVPH